MKSEIGLKTRIGKIRYTNCLPFYHNLQDANFDFFESHPAEISRAMHEERIDIAPISSFEYLQHQDRYLLLSPFIIGARDFSQSVILFSREKLERLDGAEIAITRESLSSAALLKVLLKTKCKFDNQFVPADSNPEKMLSEHKAALVIGDDALFFRSTDFFYKYDLSELWWNWTEKPFCFALWAVRRAYAEENPEEVEFFVEKLKSNLHKNISNIEGLIKESLGHDFLHARYSKVFGYLFNLTYGLDQSMTEGLELFYRMAHRLELAPRPKPLQFFGNETR